MSEEARAAGRPLDVDVLRTVFGVKHVYCRYGETWDGDEWPFYIPSGKPWRTHSIDAVPVPKFSTDIASAWLVVERMSDLDYSCRTARIGGHGTYNAAHFKLAYMSAGGHQEVAETMPLAICRAALAALRAAAGGGGA